MIIVPPGGFAGFSQMTPASRQALMPATRSTGARRRKRKATTTKSRKRRGSKAKRGGARRLKFGSKAWRAKYGAKARRNARKARKAK
jgi:hypothetical protein